MRRVSREELLRALTIWIRLAHRHYKKDLVHTDSTKRQAAEIGFANDLLDKMAVAKHEMVAYTPSPDIRAILGPTDQS